MRLDYGKVLMMAALLVGMPRWAGAFISADAAVIPPWVDGALQYANLLAGIGMGFLEVLAAAYMLDAWGKMKPKKTWNAKGYDHKWKVLTGFIAGLFLLMPLILTPYIVARMNNQSMAATLQYPMLQILWSFAVVLSPVFVVGGVSVASGDLVANEMAGATQARQSTQPKGQPVKQPQGATVQPVAPEVEQLSGTRALVAQAYRRNPRATQQEVADFLAENHGVEISRQMVGKHKRALNGGIARK